MIQRVIDIAKIDPQVLNWAITRQANIIGEKSDVMLDQAMAVIKRVSQIQKGMKLIESNVTVDFDDSEAKE